MAEVAEVDFPTLLDPAHDTPPATIITRISRQADGSVLVRGTAMSDQTITSVRVNGLPASPVEPNFAEWEIVVKPAPKGATLTAIAEDEAGHVEATPHVRRVE